MEKLQTLEELRTRKEVKDYFKQLGKEITEEELNALKQSYSKAQESNAALTLEQLDGVAGGKAGCHTVCILFDMENVIYESQIEKYFKFYLAGHKVDVIYRDKQPDEADFTVVFSNMNHDGIISDSECPTTIELLEQGLKKLFPDKALEAEFFENLGETVKKFLDIGRIVVPPNHNQEITYYILPEVEQNRRKSISDGFEAFLKSRTNNYFVSYDAACDAYCENNKDISKPELISLGCDIYYNYMLVSIPYIFIIRELHDNPQITEDQIIKNFKKLYGENQDLMENFNHSLAFSFRYYKEKEICLETDYNECFQQGYYPDLSAEAISATASIEH